ncbi:MAG TPA: N-acetylmuramoyl-L-alanine amidase [Kofleriaceae bacterium]|nr:N-acetylmuramoyl-L-alanine amidase [Kofleriaceae bacterium]
MGAHTPSGKVVIGGQFFQTEAPIVNFTEGPRWDARSENCYVTATDPSPKCTMKAPGQAIPYGKMPSGYETLTKRYLPRPMLKSNKAWNNGENAPYDAVKSVIKQFVIHHDGCATADMCFSVLHNERGLSCHFLCDNDGIIYQTLDLALMGFHAGAWNTHSIGVELCNRGDAKKEPTYYSKKGVNRPIKPCKVNNHAILSYDFTEKQYDSMRLLSRALLRLLPNLPAEYPQTSPGVQSWDTLDNRTSFSFSGYIGHYHLTDRKWDPGPFDFKDYCRKIRGAFCFPVFPKGVAEKDQDKPVVPEQADLLKTNTDLLYARNESQADGGFFPVGPWGEMRLWHGGVHLSAQPNDLVFAPFPGRLVAARMGPDGPIGSTNFALLRHQMTVGDRKLEFYSLYMHLANELASGTPVDWLAKAKLDKTGTARKLAAGEVWLLDEPIEAGATIGHAGKAGPDDLSKPQIHFELFSISDLFEGMKGSPWEVVDGTSGGRFSDSPRINEAIDANKDGVLSRPELTAFYQGGAGSGLRYLVTRHVSEWTNDPPWGESLRLAKDFRELKSDKIDQLVAEQITPTLWWDERVAAHCKLPVDGVVYHYNPVTFVSWLNQQINDAAAQAGPREIKATDTSEVPPGITDDGGEKDGNTMRSTEQSLVDPCNDKLTLKELARGFEAEDCAP